MTSTNDATTDFDDIIETPIDLTSVDKSQLLFYLAASTPLSVADLAEDCTSGSSKTKSILRDRFGAEINIDMTDTVRLSGDARRAVITGSKPLIKSGQERLKRGKSYLNRDNYDEAADCFAQAVSNFQKVKECYDAVSHESSKLEKLVATTKERHDSAANEAAKDSINYYILHATQYESEGDKHIEKKPSRATENYRKAANQLSQALETAEEYNQSMWQDSSKLSLQPVKEKLSKVSEKLDSIGDTSSTPSTKDSSNSADSVGEDQIPGEVRNQDLINALQRLAMKIDEPPRLKFVNKYGEYSANEYIESFGSWADALAAANLDPIDGAARERRTYSRTEVLDAVVELTEELGHLPSKTEMNRKGTVSDTTVRNRFEDRETALSLAKTRIEHTAEQQNETEEQHKILESTTEAQRVADDSGDRIKNRPYDDQSEVDSNKHPESSASSSGSGKESMLEAINNLHGRLGRVPNATEVAEECEYAPNDFYNEFGSWGEALEAAGIDKEQGLLKDIRRVAEKLGHAPTTTEINEHGTFSSGYYASNFGSWDAALQQAGVKQDFGKKSEREKLEREKMLKTVKSLHNRLGRAPKATELLDDCGYSQHDFYSEFGSWDEALKTAGIDKEQSMLDEVERVAEKLGRVPSTVDMQEHGVYTSYSSYFGSWSEALEQADVEQTTDSGSSGVDREAMLEIIKQLNNRLGRIPKTTEIPERCGYSSNDFYDEFGSWDETLEAAGIDKEEALLNDLKKVAEKIGRAPKSSDMDEYGKYASSTYSSYFDSWDTALKRAGITKSNKESLIETLQILNDKLDRLPKTSNLRDVPGLSQHDYIGEFGSWDEALEAAGIDKEQYLVDDLRQVAADIDSKPKTTDVNQLGEYSAKMYQEYFDSWDAALEAAGLSSVKATERKRQEVEKESNGTTDLAPSTQVEELASHIDIVGNRSISRLKTAGYTTLDDLRGAALGNLTNIRGIGPTKAQELVRFTKENVSSEDTSSNQSSNDSRSRNRPSTPIQGTDSNRIQPGALNTSWESIPANERVNEQFLLQVTDVKKLNRGRKTARLSVQDQNGREFKMNIWSKHNIDQNWREGQWYALENARGKVWESSDGTTRKQLSSTNDLGVIELGEDFDPNVGSIRSTSGSLSEPQQQRATTNGDVPGSTPDPTVSERDTDNQGDSSEDDSPEDGDDGILDNIVSDFDEI